MHNLVDWDMQLPIDAAIICGVKCVYLVRDRVPPS